MQEVFLVIKLYERFIKNIKSSIVSKTIKLEMRVLIWGRIVFCTFPTNTSMNKNQTVIATFKFNIFNNMYNTILIET